MSGNPFRKQPSASQQQQQQQQQEQWPPPPSFNTARSDVAVESSGLDRRESKGKRVRIETPPPLSPDSPFEEEPIIRRVSNESHEGSPPPSPDSPPERALFASPWDAYDPLNFPGVDDDLFPSNEVLENTRRNSQTNNARWSSTGGIVNPFQRTLATMEGNEGVDPDSINPQDTPAEDTAHTKPQMDVDAFKRMLMAGTAEPSSSTTAPPLLEPEISPTSIPATLSSNKSPPVHEPATRKSAQLPPPPPPAHRHGKPVEQQRVPQTVSFDEFTPTEASNPPLSTLPPQPLSQPITDSPKKRAPTPPQARKSAQAQATPQRQLPVRENSSSSVARQENIPSNQPLASSPLPPPASKSSTGKVPPPPPSRRSGPKPSTSSDGSSSQPSTFLPYEESSHTVSSRSSSRSSKTRIALTAPPPPPPRRRTSSKGSNEISSSSAGGAAAAAVDSTSHQRSASHELPNRPSLESAAQATPTSDNQQARTAGSADILADMDRLQAEVDALRARYNQR